MTKLTQPQNSKQLASFCAKLTAEKIANDIIVMDLSNYETAPADYFVMCSTDSENQSQAILELILRQAKNSKLTKPRVEGETSSDWILIDFFDVVVHIMLAPIREYYNIEKLWNEAECYVLNAETGKLSKKKK